MVEMPPALDETTAGTDMQLEVRVLLGLHLSVRCCAAQLTMIRR